jgi:hypothetical protein
MRCNLHRTHAFRVRVRFDSAFRVAELYLDFLQTLFELPDELEELQVLFRCDACD